MGRAGCVRSPTTNGAVPTCTSDGSAFSLPQLAAHSSQPLDLAAGRAEAVPERGLGALAEERATDVRAPLRGQPAAELGQEGAGAGGRLGRSGHARVAERHQPEVGLAPEQRYGQAAAAAGLAGAGPADRSELAEAL